MLIEDNATVLFIGDSITDAGRDRANPDGLGQGYAMLAAGWFGSLYPEKNVRFLNRGISGNRVCDLQARWQADCLDLRPAWVSILIGINDTWRRNLPREPTTVEEFESGYRDILDQTRKALGAKVILCEPFLLHAQPALAERRPDLNPKIDVVRKLALEYKALYVPFDGLFAQAAARAEPAFWAGDGVHPTPAGHALMAQAWLKTIE